ncbi:hypothetical protein T492DRAFT_842768 [Pavlovales sp. CCMP2436]|nr:hypothetical protein T492DRAFT_842768 [Pavlovales sp. CCMP2436]
MRSLVLLLCAASAAEGLHPLQARPLLRAPAVQRARVSAVSLADLLLLAEHQARTAAAISSAVTARYGAELASLADLFSLAEHQVSYAAVFGSEVAARYGAELVEHPLKTHVVTAASLFLVGDAISQSIQAARAIREPGDAPVAYDVRRAASFGLFSAMWSGVFQAWWFDLLNGNIPGGTTTTDHLIAAVEKTAMCQLVSAPLVYLPLLFTVQGLVRGWSAERTLSHSQANYRPLLQRNWSFWWPVQLVQFSAVTAEWQLPFVCSAALVWAIILSGASEPAPQLAASSLADIITIGAADGAVPDKYVFVAAAIILSAASEPTPLLAASSLADIGLSGAAEGAGGHDEIEVKIATSPTPIIGARAAFRLRVGQDGSGQGCVDEENCSGVGGGGGSGDDAVAVTVMPMAMPSVLLSPPAQPTPSSSGLPHVTPLGGSERAADSASIRPPPGAPLVLPAQPIPVPLTQPTPSGSGPPQRRNSRPAGIYADLDTGDEEDEDTGNDTSSSSECLFSTFRHALQRRPQKELTGDGTWLLNMLRESAGAGECWRLPAARVNVACKEPSLGPINEAYCRDIVV